MTMPHQGQAMFKKLNTNRMRKLMSGAAPCVLLFLSGQTSPAQAQTFCNPMYMPPGACVPYDHMLERQKQAEQLSYEQRTRIWSPAQWDDFVQAGKESARQRVAELQRQQLQDPNYKRLKKGGWEFHQSSPAAPLKWCQAVFMNLNGGALLMKFGRGPQGTYIGYFGPGIDKPSAPTKLSVSLTQSNETQTVQAMHVFLPWDGRYGLILLAVPSPQALVESIEEEQDFSLAAHQQPLISGKWHEGNKAREWLGECIKQLEK